MDFYFFKVVGIFLLGQNYNTSPYGTVNSPHRVPSRLREDSFLDCLFDLSTYLVMETLAYVLD